MSTAVDTETGTISLTPGAWLVGEYLSTKHEPGRQIPESDPPRSYPDRYVITLLVGDRTSSVAAREEADAIEVTKDVTRGDQLVVPVYVRAAKGYVFYDLRK